MKKIILSILISIFIIAPSFGKFVPLSKFSSEVMPGMWLIGETKIDYSSIAKKNGYYYVWTLSNYERNDLPYEKPRKSSVSLTEIDCAYPRGKRLVISKSYSNFDAKGKLVENTDFRQHNMEFDIEGPNNRNILTETVCTFANR